MSALTIHQIKETVKRIEEKVDKLLAEPLNTAIRQVKDEEEDILIIIKIFSSIDISMMFFWNWVAKVIRRHMKIWAMSLQMQEKG